jgi:hypothetical protein
VQYQALGSQRSLLHHLAYTLSPPHPDTADCARALAPSLAFDLNIITVQRPFLDGAAVITCNPSSTLLAPTFAFALIGYQHAFFTRDSRRANHATR